MNSKEQARFNKLYQQHLTELKLQGLAPKTVDSHSWSTVKLDRNGLQFFYRHVLDKQWDWVRIFKPPQ